MNRDDTLRLTQALAVLAEVHDKPLTPVRVEAYRQALGDLPIAEIEAAVVTLTRTSCFFPKPAEIREVVRRQAPPPEDWYDECGRLHAHACVLDRYQHLLRVERERWLAEQAES
jgi:hypothetical protein